MRPFASLVFTVSGLLLGLPAFSVLARDTAADEFNTIAAQIQNPPGAAWLRHAYSTNYMPKSTERDGVDVLLRRTSTILDEFNEEGLLHSLAARLQALREESSRIAVSSRTERLELFRRIEEVSRRAAFANPLLRFKDILFLKRQKAKYNHMVDQYFGFHAVPGGGLFILRDALSAEPVMVDVLANSLCENGRFKGRKLDFGSFLGPSLSYDGKTIYFCHTEAAGPTYTWNEHTTFHIFRVNADGTGLRQLTDGPVNDLFPYPLPNGRIVFVSERRGGFGRCHERLCPTYTLYTMNANGTDITMLSAHETNEWHPWVDNNGMIVYTRWDYVDRGDDQAHHPWITYPDGRDARSIQGNWKAYRSDSPYMEMDVRSIPGSDKYVSTAAAHHGQSYGSFVLIDPRVEDDSKMAPLKVLTPEAQLPEATTSATADWKFATAWALNERFYLCGYDPGGNTHAITLLDAVTGLKSIIYHDPAISCAYPIPLIARPSPPLIPHRVASGKPLLPGEVFDASVYTNMPSTGTMSVMNVYDSTLPLPEGTVIKYLRIIEVLPKTTWHHTNPHMGYAQEKPGRRVLGTVPVDDDGSAHFVLPADTPVFFQALDADKQAVQSMRSLTYVKPGDQLGCAGCHEKRGTAPLMSLQPTAVQRAPSPITPEVPGSNPFSYPRLVQPVLNQYCVSCHQSQGAPDLTAGNYSANFNYWYNSYLNLAPFAFYYGAYANAGYDTWNTPISVPGQVGAKASRLFKEVLSTNHHNLQLPKDALYRLTLWLDCNSDFFGAYESTLAQSQGQIVQPIDPRVTGYQSVTNTTYGAAIPVTPTRPIANNDGLSQFGTALELGSPMSGGVASRPVILGQIAEAGLPAAAVEAGPDLLAYVTGPSAALQGSVTIQGQPPVPGTVLTWWTQLAGPTNALLANPQTPHTTATFTQPGSYVLRLMATTGVITNSDDLLITVLPANQVPLVEAGPDQVLRGGATNTLLAGTMSDDSGGALAIWTQVSGPAAAILETPRSPVCPARFPQTGRYVLRLTANDGLAITSDECAIEVMAQGTNSPPSVLAGADIQTSFTNNPIQLQGTVSDDGLPGPLTVTWSFISGPGTVVFGNPGSATSAASFSRYGYYLLQLTATDGERTAYDQLAVYLYPGDGSMSFGSIRREVWTGLSGNSLSTLTNNANYPDHPSYSSFITSFQVPNSTGDSYGSRVHGFLFPPTTGYYTFWLASDDDGELWLSTNANPAGVRRIASVSGWTDPLQWTKFASQRSGSIYLAAGQSYYIMAMQKEGGGGDHLSVAWQGPGIAQSVIDGYYLAPYPTPIPPLGSVTRAYWTGIAGNAITDLTQSPNYPNSPSSVGTLTSFEGPTSWGDEYGSRIQALLHPPADGAYTFWIASDDNGELWFSTNANPAAARLIASVPVWTDSRQWNKYSSQQSATIMLKSNQVCYMMALQKDGGGGDNLAVAWQGPGIPQAVIPGRYLSDYVDNGEIFPTPSTPPVVLDLNSAPQVSAGADQELDFFNNQVSLRGQVFDDGLPADPGTLAIQWSKVGGPGAVTFSNALSVFTVASFSQPGLYLLRLEASDGELSSSDTVAITVNDLAEFDFFYSSPQDLVFSPDGSALAVADAGLNRVVLLDSATRTVRRVVPVEGTPRGMAWENTNSLWVCEYEAGSLAKVDAVQGTVTRRFTTGRKPADVKVDSLRRRLVVSDFGGAKVWILNLDNGEVVAGIPVVEKPMYLAISPNRQFALVANSEAGGDARNLSHAAVVSVIDLETLVASEIKLPPGSTSLRGIAISPDGHWAYVAHLLSRTYLPTTQLNNGWVLNNAVSILDLTTGQVYSTVPLDALEGGAANPWGLALSDDGQALWVSASGVHEVVRLNLSAIHALLATNAQQRATMESDLITLYERHWITRQVFGGKGPRGISLSPDGDTLAVAAYFSGQVYLLDTQLPLGNSATSASHSVATGPQPPEHALRRGERIYFDGDGCFQRWISCASCHPGARADGLNWDLLNDGIGNPKNTLSHVFSTETPPSMSTGVRASVAVAIQAGFKFIQFQQRSDQEMQDAFDFLASLRPEPSPHLNRKWLTLSAMRGKAIFEDPVVGCASCHNGPYLTDLKRRDVGTGHPADVGPHDPVYDTPGLHELWRTGPYLHDGSAPTLRDVLTTANTNDLHGVTSHLSAGQIDDLVAYLEQIGGATNWVNGPPIVEAGPGQTISLPSATIQVAAVSEDEGLPGGILTVAWTVVSGPAAVAFGSTNAATTTATFMTAGEYVLRCTANDGELSASDTVTVNVTPAGSLTDSDADGMGDFWEQHYFGGLTAANGGPNDDWDGDGLSNLYEYLTGTDPTNPDSAFHLEIASLGEQIAVEFPAHAAGTSLTPGQRFFTLQTGVPVGAQITWRDVPGYNDLLGADQQVQWTGAKSEPILFFRVRVRLEP